MTERLFYPKLLQNEKVEEGLSHSHGGREVLEVVGRGKFKEQLPGEKMGRA